MRESSSRAMTGREKARLVLFVLGRESVLVLMGLLVSGISLSALLSYDARERTAGVLLAGLLLLTMGLYLWIKLQADLQCGQVLICEIEVLAKEQERHEATTWLYLLAGSHQKYEVSQRQFNRVLEGEAYRLTHTARLNIVLDLERI